MGQPDTSFSVGSFITIGTNSNARLGNNAVAGVFASGTTLVATRAQPVHVGGGRFRTTCVIPLAYRATHSERAVTASESLTSDLREMVTFGHSPR